jgi:hypothetical protein
VNAYKAKRKEEEEEANRRWTGGYVGRKALRRQ